MMTDGAAKLKLAASCRQLLHAKNIAIEHDLERVFVLKLAFMVRNESGHWLAVGVEWSAITRSFQRVSHA
jgi:hypothetical protein